MYWQIQNRKWVNMIDNYITVKCPNCKKKVLCDLHECGCIFGKCECGLDIEKTDKCQNNEQLRIKK